MKLLFLKLMDNTKYTFYAFDKESVSSLKNKIEACLNFKKEIQRLSYRGYPLTDDFILDKIPNNSVIRLTLQLATIPE